MSESVSQPTPYEKVVGKAFSEAIPLNAQIEITYRCNHLCTFCYNSPTGQREMTTPQIFEALKKDSDNDVLDLIDNHIGCIGPCNFTRQTYLFKAALLSESII